MIQRCVLRLAMLFLFILLFPLSALAIPKVSLSFAGNNNFILTGANLEDVGKIQVVIAYDASSLSNPRLVPNSSFAGAIVTVDSDTAGALGLTVASGNPMNGRGAFATIAFNPAGTSVGTISSLKGRVYGANGAPLSAMFDFTNPTPSWTRVIRMIGR